MVALLYHRFFPFASVFCKKLEIFTIRPLRDLRGRSIEIFLIGLLGDVRGNRGQGPRRRFGYFWTSKSSIYANERKAPPVRIVDLPYVHSTQNRPLCRAPVSFQNKKAPDGCFLFCDGYTIFVDCLRETLSTIS